MIGRGDPKGSRRFAVVRSQESYAELVKIRVSMWIAAGVTAALGACASFSCAHPYGDGDTGAPMEGGAEQEGAAGPAQVGQPARAARKRAGQAVAALGTARQPRRAVAAVARRLPPNFRKHSYFWLLSGRSLRPAGGDAHRSDM